MTIAFQTDIGTRLTGMVKSYTFKKNPAILDIMADGRFKGQVRMPCIPEMEYSIDSLHDYVVSVRPSLVEVNFEVLPTDNRVL